MIYRRVFLNYFKTSLIFLGIILFSSLFYLLLYPKYQENEFNLTSIYLTLDSVELNFLHISLKSFNNISYYYLIYLNLGSLLFFLLAIILAIKTIKDDTIYNKIFITRPQTVKSDLKKKIALALFNILIVDLVIFLFLLIYFMCFNVEHAFSNLFYLFLAIIFSQLTLYALSLAISSFLVQNTYVLLVTILMLIILVIISIIYKVTSFKPLAYICPLSYFDYLAIFDSHTLGLDYLVAIVIIVIFGFNLAICEYERTGGGKNV